MSVQWKLCQSCTVRHCNKAPVRKVAATAAGTEWKCDKYRKHQVGFKFSEVRYEKEKQV
jgi:predicted metal-binding protein